MALVVFVGVLVVAVAAAALIRRQITVDAPTQPAQYLVPAQLDRADFTRADAPWLVAVFTSKTCSSCAATLDKAAALASDQVAVQEVEFGARRDLHDRYEIEAVPMTLVADSDGVVRASFIGTPGASELWAAVAQIRDDRGAEGQATNEK